MADNIIQEPIGETPVTDIDRALMSGKIDPAILQQYANAPAPAQEPTVPASPMPTTPIKEYPGLSTWDRAAGILEFALPGIGSVIAAPGTQKLNKREQLMNRDAATLKFLSDQIKEDPRKASQMMRSPAFREAQYRGLGWGDEDIQNISTLLADKKLSNKEKMTILAAQGDWDEESGQIIRPAELAKPPGEFYKVQREKEEYDAYEKAMRDRASKEGNEIDDLDIITGWNALQTSKGKPSDVWKGLVGGDNFLLYNTVTGKEVKISTRDWVDMQWQIVADANGVFGLTAVPKKAKIVDGKVQPIPHMYFSIEQLMEGASPRDIKIVKGHEPGWKEIFGRVIKEKIGINPEALLGTISPGDPSLQGAPFTQGVKPTPAPVETPSPVPARKPTKAEQKEIDSAL